MAKMAELFETQNSIPELDFAECAKCGTVEDWKLALAEIQKSMREDFISQIKTSKEKENN